MKHKPDMLAPAEVTVTLPQGMDCRDPRNRVAPWDMPLGYSMHSTDRARQEGLNALFGMSRMQDPRVLAAQQQLTEAARAGLGGLQMQAQLQPRGPLSGLLGAGAALSNLTGRRQ